MIRKLLDHKNFEALEEICIDICPSNLDSLKPKIHLDKGIIFSREYSKFKGFTRISRRGSS